MSQRDHSGFGRGRQFCRGVGLGADHVIGDIKENVAERIQSVDLVFDLVGGNVLSRSFAIVRRGGIVVFAVVEPNPALAEEREAQARRLSSKPDGRLLARIADLIDPGNIQVTISKVYAMDDVAAADQRLEAGHSRGKLALRLD
jgi:NADPH:quinone reductase-like Zn-dependent oxidoreductase